MEETFAQVAVDIAREAGLMLRTHLLDGHAIDDKSDAHDRVTEMDRRVETFITDALKVRFPHHDIRAEEGTRTENADARYRWHIDPLDGTNNYIHRLPWFAVSMAVEEIAAPPLQRVAAGVVYHVMLDEMYVAWRGGGAWCNGQRIRVSDESRLERSLLATGVAYWGKAQPETIVSNLERAIRLCGDIRRCGAAALDLACVAGGRYEAYFEEGVQTWDVAAGVLLVREAGGVVTDYDGFEQAMPTAHILASNGRVHPHLQPHLAGQYRP